MTADVSVILPWRDSGDPHRQANLSRVLDHLAETELPLILADDGRTSGPFNRSAAYNHGMRLSPSAVYVFHEADMIVPLEQLAEAVQIADLGLGLVVPFTEYRYLSEEDSRHMLSGDVEPDDLEPEWTMPGGRSVGAVGVLSAESMRFTGQWDETLEGHGYDDNAMHAAFEVACGPTRHVLGDGHHLWHPMAYAPWERNTPAADMANFSPEEIRATMRNRERVREYQRATTPARVRELTAGGR